MTTWKHRAAIALGNALNVYIVRKGRAWLLPEEEELTRFFSAFEIDCVFDVGANAGQYATRLREMGFRGFIISVEPIPKFAAQLRAAASRDDRWFVEAAALDDGVKDVNFNVMASSEFSSLRRPDNSQTPLFGTMNAVVEILVLTTMRLDSLYDSYQAKLGFRRPFLKMDTQGNDVAVARGAGDRLAEFVGLQSELSIKQLYEGQCGYREAIDFYEASGFVLSSFVPSTPGHFPDLIETDCIMYNAKIAKPKVRTYSAAGEKKQ